MRVAEVFEKYGFIVKKQEPYIDPFDSKQKSIDVLAILRGKVTTFSNRIPLDRDVTVEMRIFIECKYTPDEVILFTEPPERANQEQAFFRSGYESFCTK